MPERQTIGRLDGRIALVAGAAVSIGRAIAERLAREGAPVVVADRKIAEGKETAAALRDLGAEGMFVATDVAAAAQVRALVGTTRAPFGRLPRVAAIASNHRQ